MAIQMEFKFKRWGLLTAKEKIKIRELQEISKIINKFGAMKDKTEKQKNEMIGRIINKNKEYQRYIDNSK